MVRPRAAALPGRAAAVPALAAGARGADSRHGFAGHRRDADPGPVRRAVRGGVEPARCPGGSRRDGGRPHGRLDPRVRRHRGRDGGSGRAPAASACGGAAAAQARAGRRIGCGDPDRPRYEHLVHLAARRSAGPDGRARLRVRRLPARRRLRDPAARAVRDRRGDQLDAGVRVGDRHARRCVRRDRVAPGYGTRPRLTVADRVAIVVAIGSVRCGRGCRARWIDGSTGLATTHCIA